MRTHIQFFRYVLVGLASNIMLYVLYLFLTYQGLGAKTAMSGLYLLGMLQTFIFNRKWVFSHNGQISSASWRYLTCYALGYLVNLIGLLVLFEDLGFRHEFVQGGMIIFVAILQFFLQKLWVFTEKSTLK